MTARTHTLELPGEATSVAAARRFVADQLVGQCLPALVDDVMLVVSELATNAVVHAASAFDVTVRSVGRRVIIEIRDDSQLGPVRSNQPMGTHGRGIAIVIALSREWGVVLDTNGGKTVWASFDA